MDKMLKSLDLHKERKEQKKAAAKRIENLKLATKDPLEINFEPFFKIYIRSNYSELLLTPWYTSVPFWTALPLL